MFQGRFIDGSSNQVYRLALNRSGLFMAVSLDFGKTWGKWSRFLSEEIE